MQIVRCARVRMDVCACGCACVIVCVIEFLDMTRSYVWLRNYTHTHIHTHIRRMKCESCGVPVCYQNKDFTTDKSDVEYLYVRSYFFLKHLFLGLFFCQRKSFFLVQQKFYLYSRQERYRVRSILNFFFCRHDRTKSFFSSYKDFIFTTD